MVGNSFKASCSPRLCLYFTLVKYIIMFLYHILKSLFLSTWNEFCSWNSGDPIQNQIDNSYNLCYFSVPMNQLHIPNINKGKRLKSYLLISLSLISCVRFFVLSLYGTKSDDQELFIGSVQSYMGVSAKVMYLTMGFLSLESFTIRAVFVYMENRMKMSYLSIYFCPSLGLESDPTATRKGLQKAFFTGKVTMMMFLILMGSWHIITTVIRLQSETSEFRSMIWIVWTALNFTISVIAMIDFINVPTFWAIAVATQKRRQEVILEIASSLVMTRSASDAKRLFELFKERNEQLSNYMSQFNLVSGMFVFPINICSTFINGSLIFGTIHAEEKGSIFVITALLAFLCVNQSMAIMVGSATMMTTTRKIYRVLCNIPSHVSHTFLSWKQKQSLDQLTKSIGGRRSPLAIWGREGEVYDSRALYENLLSTFLLVIQFLELTRGFFGNRVNQA